jgi:hypothetical protein
VAALAEAAIAIRAATPDLAAASRIMLIIDAVVIAEPIQTRNQCTVLRIYNESTPGQEENWEKCGLFAMMQRSEE